MDTFRFFIFYLLSTNFTRTYTIQYGFDSGQVGLYYLPNAIGNILGGLAGGRFSDRVYNGKVAKLPPGQSPFPELRIGGIVLWGSLVLQFLALTAYGWCIQKNVHFAYGLVALFFGKDGNEQTSQQKIILICEVIKEKNTHLLSTQLVQHWELLISSCLHIL